MIDYSNSSLLIVTNAIMDLINRAMDTRMTLIYSDRCEKPKVSLATFFFLRMNEFYFLNRVL